LKTFSIVYRDANFEQQLSPRYTRVELSVGFCFFYYRSLTLIDVSAPASMSIDEKKQTLRSTRVQSGFSNYFKLVYFNIRTNSA